GRGRGMREAGIGGGCERVMGERRSVKAILVAFAAAFVLAACGGSGKSTPSAGPVAASTKSTPPRTTATSAPSTTTAQQSSTLCRASDLQLSFIGGQGATEH